MNQVAFLASDKRIPAHFGAIANWLAPSQPRATVRRATVNEEASASAPAIVYLVDVGPDALNSVASAVRTIGLETQSYSDIQAFYKGYSPERPGCVLLDANPSMLESFAPPPVDVRVPIIMTAEVPDVRMVVLAMKLGAVDFLEKPLRPEDVIQAAEFAISLDRERRTIEAHREEVCRRFETLSNRERQVLVLVTEGKLNKQVAYELGISEITVKAHRGCVMRKMGARTFAGLVRMADLVAERLSSRVPAPCAL